MTGFPYAKGRLFVRAQGGEDIKTRSLPKFTDGRLFLTLIVLYGKRVLPDGARRWEAAATLT